MLTATLKEATDALSSGDRRTHALNTGQAAGLVLAADWSGLESMVAYDAISDAFENDDADALDELRRSLVDLYENSGIEESQIAPSHSGDRRYPSWDEYGSAISEAMEARNAGDGVRYALMIGLASGMLFSDPGPRYENGTVLDKITRGYDSDEMELLQEARGHVMFGVRMTAPVFGVSDEEVEQQMTMMRRVQNFGLRIARSGDESVRVPVSTSINLSLLREAREQRERE